MTMPNNPEPQSVEQILQDLAFGTGRYSLSSFRGQDVKDALAAIERIYKRRFEKVVGKKEPENDIEWQIANLELDPYHRNKLRAEIRTNWNKLKGGKNE